MENHRGNIDEVSHLFDEGNNLKERPYVPPPCFSFYEGRIMFCEADFKQVSVFAKGIPGIDTMQ